MKVSVNWSGVLLTALMAATVAALPVSDIENKLAARGSLCNAGEKQCGTTASNYICCDSGDYCYTRAGTGEYYCATPDTGDSGSGGGGLGGTGTFEEPRCWGTKKRSALPKKFDQWLCE